MALAMNMPNKATIMLNLSLNNLIDSWIVLCLECLLVSLYPFSKIIKTGSGGFMVSKMCYPFKNVK